MNFTHEFHSGCPEPINNTYTNMYGNSPELIKHTPAAVFDSTQRSLLGNPWGFPSDVIVAALIKT